VVNIAREDITEQSSVKEFFTTKASPIKVIIMYPKLAVQKRKKRDMWTWRCKTGNVVAD
jgi:hypothetical protein